MRCWHQSLISYLPRQQLLGQWRECCCIAKNIAEKGTPNHILVNKVVDYPIEHFISYSYFVFVEMAQRGYKCNTANFKKWLSNQSFIPTKNGYELFSEWHNNRYLIQCMFNLEEKHDCQGVTNDEWNTLLEGYKKITGKDWEK